MDFYTLKYLSMGSTRARRGEAVVQEGDLNCVKKGVHIASMV